MERAGETVFSLCVGEPDYQPPHEVLLATAKAAELGLTKYTAVNGESKLRQAIAHDLSTRKSTPYSSEEILVSSLPHISEAILVTILLSGKQWSQASRDSSAYGHHLSR